MAAANRPEVQVVQTSELIAALYWPGRHGRQRWRWLALMKVPGRHARVGAAVGGKVGVAVGADVVGSSEGAGVGQAVPIEFPVVIMKAVTLPERAWSSVGTSEQNRFESRAKKVPIWLSWPSCVGMAEESELTSR